MRGSRAAGFERADQWDVSEESDIAVALIRTAFFITFALTPYVTDGSSLGHSFIGVMLLIAAGFNLILLGCYLRRWKLPLRRPAALLIDLALVSAAIASFDDFAPQRQWLVPIYYLIIMIAAIWYRRIGAVLVAFLASILYGVFVLHLYGWSVLWHGHTPVLLLMAVMASYIVIARDREHRYASRLERDMALARHLQDEMLPPALPSVPGFDLGVRFRPARHVGGDLYDVAVLPDGRLLICIGDMPGKSVYGLVHLSLVHSHVRAASRRGVEPAQAAKLVNDEVYAALQPESYAPLFIAIADSHALTLTFVNCGHLPPLLVRGGPEGEVVELSTDNIVIGAMREPEYRQATVHLRPGDVVICYTDGIVEARGRRDEEYGVGRLVEAARAHSEASADALCELIMADNTRFSPAANDDRTVLVLKVTKDSR